MTRPARPAPDAEAGGPVSASRSVGDAARREVFLLAVERLMAEGRRDVTVQEVADAAGESLRTFYQHFGGKRELVVELFTRHFAQLASSVEQESRTRPDPLEALRAGLLDLYRQASPRAFRKALPVAQFGATLVHSDPALYARAQAPLLAAVEEMVRRAVPGHEQPRRAAASAVDVVLAVSRRNAVLVAQGVRAVTSEEVWRALGQVLFESSRRTPSGPPP